MALKASAAHHKDITTGLATLEHRHFATIATIIRDMQNRGFTNSDCILVAEHFANQLRATNPKFDRKRFLAACGTLEFGA